MVTNEGNTTASYTVNLLLNDPVPAGFTTQLLLHKTFTTPAADGCDAQGAGRTRSCWRTFRTRSSSPIRPIRVCRTRTSRIPSLQNPTLALAPGESATITFRVVDPNIFDGVTYDASGAVTPAAVAQSVNTRRRRPPAAPTPPVAMPLTITTTEIPPTTPGAPINRTLQMVAATGTVAASSSRASAALPPGVTLSPTGTLSGTPTTPGNYVLHGGVRATGPPSGSRIARRCRSRSIPRRRSSFDALWNGAGHQLVQPGELEPARRADAGPRASTSPRRPPMVPRLTANVTVRDLFLEPGATLDTNGFTLTVTNNADAGHTIIGEGRTVLTGNGGTASGVFANLEIRGRITLTAPLTTTGTLTLGARRAARAERPAADRRRTADHQRHRRARCR